MKSLSGKDLSWLGIGTYGIGGRGHRDVDLTDKKLDNVFIEALVHQLENEMNFSEIALGYGHGNSARLFSDAIRDSSVDREELVLTNSFYPRDFASFDDVVKDLDEMYKIFKTDYFDSTLVTQSLYAKFGDNKVDGMLEGLLKNDRTRYVSLSNAGPQFIKSFKEKYGDKVFAHETHLSFEVRINQDGGVFDLCEELEVFNIIWRPLRRNDSSRKGWELLDELADKYDHTHNQVILNWVHWLGYYPMVMSSNPKHVDENLASIEFQMTDDDYERINNFRLPNLKVPNIDWEKTGDGVGMAEFAIFYENYLK